VRERPELIVRGIVSARELHPLIERADIIAIGPGLGQDGWAQRLLTAAFSAGAFSTAKGLVIDADALNLLAKQPERNERWILTPHPGEAARLLQLSTNEIQNDRMGAANSLAKRYGGTVVLKGSNTLIVKDGECPSICDQGNPAMATPGMGDVLTGVIAGLLAQVNDPWLAARAGVVAHSWAGDAAAAKLGRVERGLLASDLFDFLPESVSDHESR
jgi:NAD(P)H-hydrate epimerase